MNDICVVCRSKIVIMCFRGTDVCCENCRRERDGGQQPGIVKRDSSSSEGHLSDPEGSTEGSEGSEPQLRRDLQEAIGYRGAGSD